MTGQTPDAAKKKKKKRLIIVLSAVTLLAAVSWVLTTFPNLFAGRKNNSGVTTMYSDRNISYLFYESDYDLDPTTDEDYMGQDRQLWYKLGNLAVGGELDESVWLDYNAAVRFFAKYFRTAIAGDAETYNTFFTDHYYEDNKPYYRFAPQRIYDMHVEELSETVSGDGTTVWVFNVEYRIMKNDGSFRNDIPSDGSKKLRFTLIGDAAGGVKIDAIDYYRRAN
ncbi:MAG: hypothetical protein K6G29_05805 [Clostridiales bacterium]|nr:hypothetical protein [Clostridiales bacterium]